MKAKLSLREVKRHVEANGGTYKKAHCYVNGQEAWEVNGKLYTRDMLAEAFFMGDI